MSDYEELSVGVEKCCVIASTETGHTTPSQQPPDESIGKAEDPKSDNKEVAETSKNKDDDSESQTVAAPAIKRQKILTYTNYLVCTVKNADPAKISKKVQNLRFPICSFVGPTGSGKTKLLDCIRGYDVEPLSGWNGNVATYLWSEYIEERTKGVMDPAINFMLPGIVVAEASRAELYPSGFDMALLLCDIFVFVVDITVGVDEEILKIVQHFKSMQIDKKFIVALNKVDTLLGWKTCPNAPISKAISLQSKDVQDEVSSRVEQVKTWMGEQGLETVPIFPTSAISGDGVADVLLTFYYSVQKTMREKLFYTYDVPATASVVLVNSVRSGGEKAVCGFRGPAAGNLRAIFKPMEKKGFRLKEGNTEHVSSDDSPSPTIYSRLINS